MNASCVRQEPCFRDFLGFGNVSFVWTVTDKIAVKCIHDGSESNKRLWTNELRVYDLLASNRPCADIVQTFLCLPDLIFMQHLGGGTLQDRITSRQGRDYLDDHVISVSKKEPHYMIIRWMRELSSAAAWLEAFGYGHTDIALHNLVLDDKEHLKLIDFDNAAAFGSVSQTGTGRPLGILEGPDENDKYERVGPTTELFAIGTVLYLMLEGFEPYENESAFPYPSTKGRAAAQFSKMKFPVMGDSEIETIIRLCWAGAFKSIRRLSTVAESMEGAGDYDRAVPVERAELKARREECEIIVKAGLASTGSHMATSPEQPVQDIVLGLAGQALWRQRDIIEARKEARRASAEATPIQTAAEPPQVIPGHEIESTLRYETIEVIRENNAISPLLSATSSRTVSSQTSQVTSFEVSQTSSNSEPEASSSRPTKPALLEELSTSLQISQTYRSEVLSQPSANKSRGSKRQGPSVALSEQPATTPSQSHETNSSKQLPATQSFSPPLVVATRTSSEPQTEAAELIAAEEVEEAENGRENQEDEEEFFRIEAKMENEEREAEKRYWEARK